MNIGWWLSLLFLSTLTFVLPVFAEEAKARLLPASPYRMRSY